MGRALRAIPVRRAVTYAVLAVVTLFVAGNAALMTFANVARAANPNLVTEVTDDDLAPILALQRGLVTPRQLLAADVETTARDSLRAQAVNSVALRVLAMRAEVLERHQQASAFLSLSERASRRDVLTQLMLIEQSVQADDIPGALSHYDKALRTNSQTYSLLFPVLGAAIERPAIRQASIPYVRNLAPWMSDFIDATLSSGRAGARNAAMLLISAHVGDVLRAKGPLLIEALIAGGEFAMAQQVFQAMPGANPQVLQAPGFRAATVDPAYGLISWTAINNGSSGAVFDGPPGADARTVRVYAGPGERTLVLRRLIALPPGQYAHMETRVAASGDASSKAIWEMKCQGSAGTESIWRDTADGISYRLENGPGPRIPSGCTHQILELTVDAGGSQEGLELVIQRFALNRVGA